jgi:hypothetical protein
MLIIEDPTKTAKGSRAITTLFLHVVKLISLIKLAESNGKHQQPNPIRKKGYG